MATGVAPHPSRGSSLKRLLLGSNSDSGVENRPEREGSDGIRNVLVLDGGVSTHLEHLLAPRAATFEHRELWSSSLLLTGAGRDLVRRGHADWIEAGADVLSTVTYQCHYERSLWSDGLRAAVSPSVVDGMWRDGVALARKAIADHPPSSSSIGRPRFVAASLGCYGAALADGSEYTGAYGSSVTVDDLARFHERKFRQALENRPDAVAFETVPSLLECEAISGLLLAESEPSTRPAPTEGSVGRGAPPACWVSLACRNGDELNDGTPVSAALDALLRVPPDRLQGIGFNCCDSRCLPSLVEHFLACEAEHSRSRASAGRTPRRALALYPNSGEAWDAAASRWVPGTGHAGAADFCDQLWACVDLVIGRHRATAAAAGPDPLPPLVLVLGGCCRTSPSSIAALRKRVDEYLGSKR